MLEGIKETQHTRIEKDKESQSEIEMLYSFGVVIFEHTILKNDDYEYSICYFAPGNVYDIVVLDKKNMKVLKYDSCDKLDDKYEKYFNLINGQKVLCDDGSELTCRSHSIEYTL